MRHLIRAIAIASPFLPMTCAHADESERLDEIVVSADYQQRSLIEVPASIAVLDQQAIDEAAVAHFEELTQLVPNLNWAGGSNRARYFQLRGIGERSQYEGAPNPSVGFLIDDIDFSAIGGIASTWDMQRVEVLRGPQATRYGANALAGLVYLTSVSPTPEFDLRTRVSVGSDGLTSAAVAFGGPLTERLSYRLAGQVFSQDGFRRNAFLAKDDSNERDEQFLRGKLRYDVSDALTLDLTAFIVEQDNGYDAFTLQNTLTTFSDRPGRDAQQSNALGARITYQPTDVWQFSSITGIASSDVEFSFDADWGNQAYWEGFFAPPADAPFTADYDFFSERLRERDTINQEFRWQSGEAGRLFNDSTDWLFGVYALRLEESLVTNDDGLFSDGSFEGERFFTTSNSDYEALQMAAFGQFDVSLDERTTLSFGARIERRTTDYTDSSGLSVSPSESEWGGHVSLTRAWREDLSGYVALSRGYKMGGFNLGAVPEGRRTFDAESLVNLEAGIRWQGASGSYSLVAFHAQRNDQQVDTSFQLVPNDPSTFVFFQDNAAEGQNSGVEFEGRWQPHPQWQLSAAIGLLDASFDNFETPEVTLGDREQAHAPSYTAAVTADWRHPSGWFARVDVTAKDAFYFSNSHDQQSAAYSLTHLRAGRQWGRWELSVWARNVFDEEYAVRGFFFGNEPPNFEDTLYLRLGDPRQTGISLDWRFD
ncbi:MAG: TonB-dependent receptor [Pseudomonadota bacterium]